MKNYTIKTFNDNDAAVWNAFIEEANNATFLFHRDFMTYHSERFEDFSLMIYDENALVAVFPANRVGKTIFSHQGLTFGGLVYKKSSNANQVNLWLTELILFLKANQCDKLVIKPIISIYQKAPSFELDTFLIQNGAHLYRKDLNLAINFLAPFAISKSKLKHFKRISNLGLEIKKEQSFDLFWDEVLVPRLLEKHQVAPVHTKQEMAHLCQKFPNNIFQYNVYFESEIVAGITIFISGHVVKSQYGATTTKGEELRALDFLFINLIQEMQHQYAFFDMGTVTENNGKSYNKGLLKQKEELGCSVYSQDFYTLEI